MNKLATASVVLCLASVTSACVGEYANPTPPWASPATAGFSSITTYACDGTQVTISGRGDSIRLVVNNQPDMILPGGPLVYAGSGGTVTFTSDYSLIRWDRADGSTSICNVASFG